MFFVMAAMGAAFAEEPPPAAARTPEVWEGYVWKDGEGRLQFGRGVVAMGVMQMPPHHVGGSLAQKLLRYAVGDDNWYFWNYALERPEPKTLEGVPTVLVRLEGVVEEAGNPDPDAWPRQAPRTMRDARLRTIEFLNPEWLKDWAFFFRTPGSPFRVAERPVSTPEESRRFAEEALEVLSRMRARPGPTDAQRLEAREIDPNARVVTRFREGEEAGIQRWLLTTAKDNGWAIQGLEALPPLPPSTTVIQGWFLASPTKEAFMAKAKEAWTGDPGRLVLVHYVTTGHSTSYEASDLDEVRDHWTEAEYQARKKSTLDMAAGR